MVRLVLIGIMLVFLTGCGGGYIPNKQLVRKAIALQIEQTQDKLTEKLDLHFRGFGIDRLSISKQESLTIQSLPSYRVRGTYDLTLKLPKRELTQAHKPFDLYLQIQQQGKTWRLLLPDSSSSEAWRSYLLK
jgi:hypothetical protein